MDAQDRDERPGLGRDECLGLAGQSPPGNDRDDSAF